MMSDPASEGVPPLMSSTPSEVPSAVPVSNVPVASYFQNPPPLMFYIPPTTQTWNVPAVAPQWHLSIIIPQNTNSCSPFFQTYLKGIVIIVAAIFEICIGIVLRFFHLAFTILTGIPFWGPVLYIIAGSLTISARDNSSLIKRSLCMNIIGSIFSMAAMILNVFDLVIVLFYPMSFPYYIYVDISFSGPQKLNKGSLSLNIISSISSMVALILNIVDLLTLQCYSYNYNYSYYNYNGTYYNDYYDYEAQKLCQDGLNGSYAVLSLLLVINLLLFCVTVSTSVFECRSLSKVENVTQVFVLQNDVVLAMNPGAVPVSIPFPVTTTYAHPPPQPPAYTVKAWPDH